MGHCFPVYLDLTGQSCLVIGGGKVAARKVALLINAKAQINVISPKVTAELEAAEQAGQLTISRREFRPEDITGAFLVVSATNNRQLNQKVAKMCLQKHILVNDTSSPEQGNFIFPAVVNRGNLSIAVSTNGQSPLLAKQIKQKLADQYGWEYAEYLDIIGQTRNIILSSKAEAAERREILAELMELDLLSLISNGQSELVKERINNVLGRSGIKP